MCPLQPFKRIESWARVPGFYAVGFTNSYTVAHAREPWAYARGSTLLGPTITKLRLTIAILVCIISLRQIWH